MTNILVTGGSGFLGQNLIRRLYEKDSEVNITVVARDEGKLLDLQRHYPKLGLVMGDIADDCVVKKAIEAQDIVYHLAAFKHATHAEEHAYACVSSNIIGSLNLLTHFHGSEFIAMSTDKACDPCGVYGATKFLMEKLLQEWQELCPARPKYRFIRCGNILYSTGSVLCIWKEALQTGKEIVVTDTNATRYFWSADQAIDLIFDVQENSTACLPTHIKMKAMKIETLLEAMQEKYGKASSIKVIGMQPGENLHEKITKDGPSSEHAEKYTYEEILALI